MPDGVGTAELNKAVQALVGATIESIDFEAQGLMVEAGHMSITLDDGRTLRIDPTEDGTLDVGIFIR